MSNNPESQIVAKVIDLGLAQQLAPNTYGGLETWQWMAPETILPTLKTAYTEKCDVYSFGIVYVLVIYLFFILLPVTFKKKISRIFQAEF
jgi:serine/threonine protein kinase